MVGRGKRLMAYLAFIALLAIISFSLFYGTVEVLKVTVSPFISLIVLLMMGDVAQEKLPDVVTSLFSKNK